MAACPLGRLGRGRERIRHRAAAWDLRAARARRGARRARAAGGDDRRRRALRGRVRHRQDPVRLPRLGRDPYRDPADDRRCHRRAAQRSGRWAERRAGRGRLEHDGAGESRVKVGLRMAVNVSPDPFTTATASLTEDFLVGAVIALIVTHAWIALSASMTLLAIGITLVVLLWRRVRAALAR